MSNLKSTKDVESSKCSKKCVTKKGAAKTLESSKATATKSSNSTLVKTKKHQSPFSSFVTNGLQGRNRALQSHSNDFAYDLSRDELSFVGRFKSPMKAVSVHERQLLTSGQRGAYLAQRYEQSPDRKYNFPEATSWRIGWLHNQQTKRPPC